MNTVTIDPVADLCRRIQGNKPSVSFRFFRVDGGPVMEAAIACQQARIAAGDAWRTFVDEHGGNSSAVYANSRLIGFGSKTKPAGDAWRRSFDADDLWVPNAKTKEGRRIAALMRKLPKAPSYHGAFEAFGLYDMPVILDGNRWFRPVMFGVVGKTIWLKVPWRYYSPELLAEYARVADGGCSTDELDFVLGWKPAEGMVEVKEWEALRDSGEQQA